MYSKFRNAFVSVLLFMLFINVPSAAQRVSITKVEFNNNKVFVFFDLEDSNPSNEYILHLYSSKDNFSTPLTRVSGDVGGGIKPGARKIEWSIKEEFTTFDDYLSLEVKGRLFVPMVKLESFDAKKKYKRGKAYQLVWKGSNPSAQINIELFREGKRISGDRNLANNGNHNFFFPSDLSRGGDYQLKFSDARNQEDFVFTPAFTVRPRYSLFVKLVPFAIVGGAIIAIKKLTAKEDDPTNEDDGEFGYPSFPKP